MADTTISSLPLGTPSGDALLPYSQGGNTYSASPSALLQNVGNIGIGTSTPVSKLTIGSGTNTYPTTPSDGLGAVITLNGSSIARIVMNDGAGNFNQYLNSYYDLAATAWKYTTAGVAANRFTTTGGTYGFYVAPTSTSVGQNITWTTGLYIDNSGNVGVGNTLPTSKLDVSGDVKALNVPKAWATFYGRGTNGPCTIIRSYNISDITRTSTGQYTATFTTALINMGLYLQGHSPGVLNVSYSSAFGNVTSVGNHSNISFSVPKLNGSNIGVYDPTSGAGIAVYGV